MTTSSPPGRPETSFLGRWGSAVCAALLAVLIAIPVASRLDPIVGDLAVLEFMPSEQVSDTDIVIVTITEDTLASLPYRSPIDRRFLAELLVSLDAARPAGIGIDVLFDSPSEPEKDARLFRILDDLKAPVVLATVPASLLTEKQAAYLSSVVQRRQPGSVILQRDDADGILRHLPVNDGATPLFTEALANQRFEKTPFDSRILYPTLSADEAGPFPHYPAHTVAFLPQDWFSGKYVLIGTDLPGTDRHATPLASLQGVEAGDLPGIEIHAYVLAQLLSGRALAVPTFAQSIGLLVLFAGVSAVVFTIFRQPKVFFTGFVICLSFYVVAAWGLMQAGTALLPVLGPVTAASASVFLLALVRWRHDRLERAFVVSAFEKYVSPEVVRRLSKGEVELTQGGEKRAVRLARSTGTIVEELLHRPGATPTVPAHLTATPLQIPLVRGGEQVEGRAQTAGGDVERDDDARPPLAGTHRGSRALEQRGELLRGVAHRALVEQRGGDRPDALDLARLGRDRQREDDRDGDDVLAGDVDEVAPHCVREGARRRGRQGPRPRRGHLGAGQPAGQGAAVGRRGHATSSVGASVAR